MTAIDRMIARYQKSFGDEWQRMMLHAMLLKHGEQVLMCEHETNFPEIEYEELRSWCEEMIWRGTQLK